MNKYIFPFYRALIPKPVRTIILKKTLRENILNYFSALLPNEVDAEQKEILEFLENNPVRIFPYSFSDNYTPDMVEVFFDSQLGMHYVMLDEKRLFFKKRWGEKRIKRAWSDLMREQDPDSPHRYLSTNFTVDNNDVIVDIGAAEGNFALSVIDVAKKLYLFERDPEWAEALKATFAPWSEKVEIINKYVSDNNDDANIRFDSFFDEHKDISFVKIDVDGAESVVLKSCKKVFSSQNNIKFAICTYHKNNDETDFKQLLNAHGFTVTPSKGYMIHYYDKQIKAPYLRRGLIRAVK